MIISKELYDKCCPSYKEGIDELEQKIDEIKHSDDDMATKLCETIMKFSNSYLTPREYWKYLMQRIKKKVLANDVEEWEKACRKIAKRALFHLCYSKEWNAIRYKVQDDDDGTFVCYFNAYDDKHLKLLNFQNDFYFESGKHKSCFPEYVVRSRDLEYPHARLQECMNEYEKKSSRIPSAKLTKRYKVNKILYYKIKSVEHNVEEWFYVLNETRDVAFVADNVEYLLGKSLFKIKLWKLYISFLEEHGEYSRLLEILSLYCRFFMDDEEIKEKYKREMARFGFSGLSLKKALEKSHFIFACGIGTIRYVHIRYALEWGLNIDEKVLFVKPWTNDDGTIDYSTFRWMSEMVFATINESPDITIANIKSYFSNVIHLVFIDDIIEFLCKVRIVEKYDDEIIKIVYINPFVKEEIVETETSVQTVYDGINLFALIFEGIDIPEFARQKHTNHSSHHLREECEQEFDEMMNVENFAEETLDESML